MAPPLLEEEVGDTDGAVRTAVGPQQQVGARPQLLERGTAAGGEDSRKETTRKPTVAL
jgi:hypothetical protein